jgi:hypothetical protein
MPAYIHQLENWPQFTWNQDKITLQIEGKNFKSESGTVIHRKKIGNGYNRACSG